jgi:hypothetical protein
MGAIRPKRQKITGVFGREFLQKVSEIASGNDRANWGRKDFKDHSKKWAVDGRLKKWAAAVPLCRFMSGSNLPDHHEAAPGWK